MKIIGITGPTGAGKTTALGVLEELGAEVIDADQVYHALLAESAPLRGALTERFGPGILDGSGQIDRKALGKLAFGNPAALRDLNAITHRFILAEIGRRTEAARREGRPAVAIDAAALLESGAGERCDAVVGVLSPKELRIRRIMAREGISEDYARSRADAQPPDAFYRARCSYILENGLEDTPETFREKARALFAALL